MSDQYAPATFLGAIHYICENLALLVLFMDVPLSFCCAFPCCIIPCASSILKKKQELFPLCVHSHNDQDNSYALLRNNFLDDLNFCRH